LRRLNMSFRKLFERLPADYMQSLVSAAILPKRERNINAMGQRCVFGSCAQPEGLWKDALSVIAV
jgi:hypothetical protein